MPNQVDPAVKENYAALHKNALQDTKVMMAAYYNKDATAFNAARNARKEKIATMRELKKQLKSTT